MNGAWVRAGDVAAGAERVFRLLGSAPEPESFNTPSRRERNVVSLPWSLRRGRGCGAEAEPLVGGAFRGVPLRADQGLPRRFNQAQVLCETG